MSRRSKCVVSFAVKTDAPSDGSISLSSSCRPRLAAADSPNKHSVLPTDREADTKSTALTIAHTARGRSRYESEVLLKPRPLTMRALRPIVAG